MIKYKYGRVYGESWMNKIRTISVIAIGVILFLVLAPVVPVPASTHTACNGKSCTDITWFGSVTYMNFCFGGVYMSPIKYTIVECRTTVPPK